MSTGGDEHLVAARDAWAVRARGWAAGPAGRHRGPGQYRRSADRGPGRPCGRPGRARGRDDARRRPLGSRCPRSGARGSPPDTLGEIQVQDFPLVSWSRKRRAYRLPVIRGVVALAESLGIGLRALGIWPTPNDPPGEGEEAGASGDLRRRVDRQPSSSRSCSAIGLFFVVPVGLTSLIKGQLDPRSCSGWWRGAPRDEHLPRLPPAALKDPGPAEILLCKQGVTVFIPGHVHHIL